MNRISHFVILSVFLLTSCLPDFPSNPVPVSSAPTVLFVYRFEQPAFVGYSQDFQITEEIPFSFPVSCGLYNTFPAPIGQFLAVELSCPNGQSVLFLNTETGTITLPFTETDSHFLAWTSDGSAAYLKVDSLGSPQIIRTYLSGAKDAVPIAEFTYDLSAKPNSFDFTFTLSRGLGYGSELYLAKQDGKNTLLLYEDQFNYISFARFSPDGNQIAFIKIPDTQTPFSVGELWIMDANGENARKIADADAGHGYAANWSPDGTKIAYVARENPDDETADHSSEALISNIYIVDVISGVTTKVTNFTEGRAETPHWSPSGNILVFNVVLNGRMQVHLADMDFVVVGSLNPEIQALETGSTCCPAWMRK